jgi:hypothetical protein
VKRAVVIAALVLAPAAARADTVEPVRGSRPFRFSMGFGGSLLLTGHGEGSRNRADAHLDIDPGGRFGRFGLTAAVRHMTWEPFADEGLATIGIKYEAGAARPRLALALHGDVGASFDGAPALGGGIESTLWLIPKWFRPLALILDATAHLVIDGADETRLVLASSTRLSLSF